MDQGMFSYVIDLFLPENFASWAETLMYHNICAIPLSTYLSHTSFH